MASPPVGGLRGFVQKPLGKILLIAFSVLAVVGTFAYVSPLLAIPVFLFVGLALPILSGVKRPRFLALSGVVVLIVVAPIATVAYTQTILTPVVAANSSPIAPDGSGGAVLQNATVSPFSGGTGTDFTWNVTVEPAYLPSNWNGTNWKTDQLQLFISTCPGAIDLNASYCGGGYAFTALNYTFPANLTGPTVVTFSDKVGAIGVWSWQMGLKVKNQSGTQTHQILLVGDATWNGIEGPVIGGFATVYQALIGDIYLTDFLYLGLPYYFLLLLYMLLKSREKRRKDAIARASASIPPGPGVPVGPGQGGPPGPGPDSGTPLTTAAVDSGPAPNEQSCPNCQAVVYPGESKCWKCGATLSLQAA